MKKFLLIISILTFAFILINCFSCQKKRLNFDNLTTVEGSGEWSIPLISSHTNITKILSQLDQSGYITIQEGGSLRMAYTLSDSQFFDARDVLCFADVSNVNELEIENPYPIVLPTPITVDLNIPDQSFSLESEYLEIRNAVIKSGKLNLAFTHDFGSIVDRIRITTANIKDLNGDDLVVDLLWGVSNVEVDLAGYQFVSNQNNNINLSVLITITTSGATVSSYHVESQIDIHNFCLLQAECLLAPVEIPFVQDTSFTIFNSNYQGDITIFEPKLFVNTQNGFDVGGRFFVDTAAFTGPNLVASLLLNGPTTIDVPVGLYDQELEEVKDIYFNTGYNRFQVRGLVTLNPDGFAADVVSINYDDKLGVDVSTEVPFDFMIGHAYYRDSFDFKLDEIIKTDLLEEVTFQLNFKNDVPIDFLAQMYSYNSTTEQITDSLFNNAMIFEGSFDGQVVVNDPVYATFEYDDIQHLLESDKLILQIQLDTDDPSVQEYVSLNAEQFFELSLCVRLKYDGVIITFNN